MTDAEREALIALCTSLAINGRSIAVRQYWHEQRERLISDRAPEETIAIKRRMGLRAA